MYAIFRTSFFVKWCSVSVVREPSLSQLFHKPRWISFDDYAEAVHRTLDRIGLPCEGKRDIERGCVQRLSTAGHAAADHQSPRSDQSRQMRDIAGVSQIPGTSVPNRWPSYGWSVT